VRNRLPPIAGGGQHVSPSPTKAGPQDSKHHPTPQRGNMPQSLEKLSVDLPQEGGDGGDSSTSPSSLWSRASPAMLAQKFSLTRLKMTNSVAAEDDAASGRMASPTFSSASSPKALNSRGVSFHLPPVGEGSPSASLRRKGDVENDSGGGGGGGVFASFFGSLFGSPKSHDSSLPSSPHSGSVGGRSQVDDLRSVEQGLLGKKDFRRWAQELPGELLWGFSSGEVLLQAVRKLLSKKSCEDIIFASNLARQEAAAIALFTARTGLGSVVCEEIMHHFDDSGAHCDDSELVIPRLIDGVSSEHSPFLAPLLSGLPKLPKISVVNHRHGNNAAGPKHSSHRSGAPASGAGAGVVPKIRFCCIDLDAVHKHNDFNSSQFTLPTILTVSSSMIPEDVCQALGGPNRCRILCIKNISARHLGPLNLSLDLSARDAGGGDEAVLLPGWRGRIVGTLQQKWKKLLRDALGWDVIPYTIMEVVEDTTSPALDALSTQDALSSPKHGSPSLWRRREHNNGRANGVVGVADVPLSSILVSAGSPKLHTVANVVLARGGGVAATAAAATTVDPLLPLEPFMAKEYLVDTALRILERHPNDVTWNLHLGLLYAYAGSEEYTKAQSCFELVLREKSADHAAQLQLGLLYDRHLGNPEKARKMYEGALKTSADNANLYFLLGSLLRRSLGEYSVARRYFEAALKLDPRHVGAHAEYGWILENYVADAVGAEDHYKAAVRMEANHADANFFLGCSRETYHKDYKGARRYYTLCVASDPKHVEGIVRLGQLLDEHYQQYDEAQRHYQVALALRPAHANANHLLGFLLLMQRKDAVRAKEHFLAAIAANPEHADAHNHLGHVLWRWEKNWPEAAVSFRKAIALKPEHCNAHSNLARGLLEEEMAIAEARLHFETAIKLDADDIYVRCAYATMLLDHRKENRADVQTAFFHLEVVVTKTPSYAPGHLQLGRALLALQKSTAKARTEMEIAVELDPTLADAHNELGLLLQIKYSDWSRAADHLRRAVSLAPKHVAAHNNLGLLLWKHLDDPLHARNAFEAALAVEPLHVQVLKNLAMLLMEQFQDYKRARRRLETVLKVNPNDVDSLTLLGTLLKNKFSDYRKSKHCFETARRITPKDTTVLNELGLLYLKHLNDSVMALELFEEVLSIDPSDGCAKTNIDRILNFSKRYQERKRLAQEQQIAAELSVNNAALAKDGVTSGRTKHSRTSDQRDRFLSSKPEDITAGPTHPEPEVDNDDDDGVAGRSASSLFSFLHDDSMLSMEDDENQRNGGSGASLASSMLSELDASLEFRTALPALRR
jgi:tetratricopeptide (TPR) repeat protein